MTNNLPHLIDRFSGLNVAVIGEAMLDSYLDGSSDRICREAPVPVVAVSHRRDAPGGAANTAVNVSGLGGKAHLLSVIGDDAEGQRLRQTLDDQGVITEGLQIQPGRRTVSKNRVLAGGHMLIRFDSGDIDTVDQQTERRLISCLAELYSRCDAVIVSDYRYGILTQQVIRALADLQASRPRVLVVDSKHLPSYRGARVSAVKPNYPETCKLLGLRDGASNGARAECIAAYGQRILDITGARIAAVTLDTDGAITFERGSQPYRTYAKPTAHSRAAGAGDTFASALALALAAGADTPAAVELASAASAIVVGKEGTALCSAQELREYVSAEGKYIPDRARLAARLEFYRQQGQRIVFTNGCFDILHRGHIAYLNRAKALGDILVVGVNSDDGVRRLKGSARPINTLDDRVQVLAALSSIDHLVSFDEDTPIELIRAVRPDVFVKGGDYTRETLPEAQVVESLGGTVQILPYLKDHSTTSIIERIRRQERFKQGSQETRRAAQS